MTTAIKEDSLVDPARQVYSDHNKTFTEREETSLSNENDSSTANNGLESSEPSHVKDKFEWAQGKTGGVYIPPFKLERMKQERWAAAGGKLSGDYEGQRIAWELLKKKINACVNKINTTNITQVIPEFFRLNLIRGRGLLCRAILKAQLTSPEFTNVYAALIAVLNTKIPEIGEMILGRVILQFRKAFRRNDKRLCIATTKFIAHLVNQLVCHELLALQLLTLLLEQPTDDSVEVAVAFVKECGNMLSELSPQGLYAVFERLRGILHEGDIDKRVQYMIEALFAIRRDGFSKYPPYPPELDLIEEEDRITHEICLDDELNLDTSDDVFHFDPEYDENEMRYAEIREEILGKEDEQEEEEEEEEEEQPTNTEESNNTKEATTVIHQGTDMELIQFRRSVYLTIMSSLSFEEGAHKLVKLMNENSNQHRQYELCSMIIECCSQERTYLRFYGLLARRFCSLSPVYSEKFDELFGEYYATIHRLETSKLRNVAKFFAALLETDSISWSVMEYIRLVEEETTSSSRIFVKILFQELAENMTVERLRERLKDPYLQPHFQGLFPLDNPRNTRFAINYFTSIGLGILTEEMREHLKKLPKKETPNHETFQATTTAEEEMSRTDEEDESYPSEDNSSSSSPRPRRSRRFSQPPLSEEEDRRYRRDSHSSNNSHSDSEKSGSLSPQRTRNSDRARSSHHSHSRHHRRERSERRRRRSSLSDDSSSHHRHHRHHDKKSRHDY
jgi:pre-mRNA-splicing factor CWC22